MEENMKFTAEVEIVRFEDTDVITASPCTGDICSSHDSDICGGCDIDD